MPQITLVDCTERIPTVIEGITYFIRRVTPKERNQIIDTSTSKETGQVDYNAFCERMIAAGLLGWKEGDVLDLNRKPIPFSLEAAAYLPAIHHDELVFRIGGGTEGKEIKMANKLRNSEHTPNGNS